MNRTVKITAALFGILLLGITGTYGYFSDTLKVTNHLAVGDVNIGLAEYEKKGSTEVDYRNPKALLPGEVFSKIPRITNYAMPCWVRARITFDNGGSELEGLDESMLSGFSEEWVKRGEYYYCTEILKRKESVDLFQSVSVPAHWTELHEDQELGITIQAEAIQAANFTPDFTAMSPWGNQEIQQCIHEQNGTPICPAEAAELSVEFNGKAHKLMAVPGDFFSNMGTAMPGDVFEDTIEVSNTTDQEAEIFFRTAVEGQEEEQIQMLNETGLVIYLNGQRVYQGNLASPELEEDHSLGIYPAGQEGEMKFVLEIPDKWDNTYALRDAEVQWIFTVNEQEKTSGRDDGQSFYGDASMKGSEYSAPVKTGDETEVKWAVILVIISGGGVLAAAVYRKRRRRS